MVVEEAFFVIQFLVVVVVSGFKLWNVFSEGSFYDVKVGFMLFIGFCVGWLLSLVVFLNEPEKLVFSVLFQVETYLFLLNAIFMVAEVLFLLRDLAVSRKVVAYNSKQRGIDGD